MLDLTRRFCPNSIFIFMSTNKVYGDNPNKLKLIEKHDRYELSVNHNILDIDETMSIDTIHSFFGDQNVTAIY